jgi:ubiquinone/menaquinone biosynthesis C-methylase UbiE
MTSISSQISCPVCGAATNQKILIAKFTEGDHGHRLCGHCEVSYDEDAEDVRQIKLSANMIEGIGSRDDYRKLFVETWEIGDESGDVYTDFDWDDNEVLREGVAAHVIRAIRNQTSQSNLKILDVGCGNGFTTEILAREFGQDNLIGLDPSPMVAQLEPRTGVKGIRGTLDTVEFDAGQFDVVVIIGNLMLHSNVAATLAEAHRILKPGGIAVIDFKNILSASRMIAGWIGRFVPSLQNRTAIERNFVNMRYGLARKHIPLIAPPEKFEAVDTYDKPPRLLEFANKSAHQSGLSGVAWRVLNAIDVIRKEQAWLQMTLRKRG